MHQSSSSSRRDRVAHTGRAECLVDRILQPAWLPVSCWMPGCPALRPGRSAHLRHSLNSPPPAVPAVQAGRHADALVVASVAGGEAWDRARKAYMQAHPRPFMRMVHATLSSDWLGEWVVRMRACWSQCQRPL